MNHTGMDTNAMFSNPQTPPYAMPYNHETYALAHKIASLDPENSDIGRGMLIRLIAEARGIVG